MVVLLIISSVLVFLLYHRNAEHAQFMKKITGEWWEKIDYPEGSILSYFKITSDSYTGDILLDGNHI